MSCVHYGVCAICQLYYCLVDICNFLCSVFCALCCVVLCCVLCVVLCCVVLCLHMSGDCYSASALCITQAALPPGWELKYAPDGRRYYVDHATKTTHWTLPAHIASMMVAPMQHQFQQVPQMIAPTRTFSGYVLFLVPI